MNDNLSIIGVILGALLCISYLFIVLRHKNRRIELTDIVLIILSTVAIISSIKLGYISIIESNAYLGNLAEQRIAILVGAIAVIYVSISTIYKIFEPHFSNNSQ